jgi:hypothetical protein
MTIIRVALAVPVLDYAVVMEWPGSDGPFGDAYAFHVRSAGCCAQPRDGAGPRRSVRCAERCAESKLLQQSARSWYRCSRHRAMLSRVGFSDHRVLHVASAAAQERGRGVVLPRPADPVRRR